MPADTVHSILLTVTELVMVTALDMVSELVTSARVHALSSAQNTLARLREIGFAVFPWPGHDSCRV
ncbi:hypothetical protein [Streptomyces sp. NPDC048269]|uniref:hypothetical protein n=1 Tax=Streptomyces sp. NPDC048269 TaxID=3155753 RepID=UPI00343F1E5F